MRYTEYKTLSNVHTDVITNVAFNSDGKLLASASLDGNLYIWNVKKTSLCYHYFTGHPILSIAWADPERILCGLKDGSILCLVINSEKNRLDVTGTWGHSYPVEALAVTTNRLASGAHEELFIWRWNYNAAMSYQEREVTLSGPSSLDDDEDILITALHWSGRDGGGSPTLLVAGYMHHGIRIFETQRWGEVQHITVEGLVGHASVSPDNKYIAVSDVFTGFQVYYLHDGKSFKRFEQEINEARPVPVIWVHGGNAILGGSTINKVMIWYVHTGSKRISLPIPGNSKVLAIAAHDNSDAQVFFIACGTETEDCKFSVVIWRAEERKDHESITGSDDESSSSSPEPELAAPGRHFSMWPLLSVIMVAGIVAAHQLAGNDVFDFSRL